jgi:SNF2 family DNA or RNA helicase
MIEKLKDLQEANRKLGYSIDSDRGIGGSLVKASGEEVDAMVDEKAHVTLPEKVIIFSQFLEHIHVIEQQV